LPYYRVRLTKISNDASNAGNSIVLRSVVEGKVDPIMIDMSLSRLKRPSLHSGMVVNTPEFLGNS